MFGITTVSLRRVLGVRCERRVVTRRSRHKQLILGRIERVVAGEVNPVGPDRIGAPGALVLDRPTDRDRFPHDRSVWRGVAGNGQIRVGGQHDSGFEKLAQMPPRRSPLGLTRAEFPKVKTPTIERHNHDQSLCVTSKEWAENKWTAVTALAPTSFLTSHTVRLSVKTDGQTSDFPTDPVSIAFELNDNVRIDTPELSARLMRTVGQKLAQPGKHQQLDTGQREFAELLTAAQSGSRDAVGELIDGYRSYLLLIANQELDSAIQGKLGASDVVQETMLTAQLAIEDFRGSTHEELLSWLRGILLNDLLEAGRTYRGTAKRNIGREVSIDGDSRLNQPPIEIQVDQETPSTDAAGSELEAVLYAAMSRLSEEHQQVLRLRNWQQLSFADIGSEMNRTADAARKLWSRAVLQLQRELGDAAED